MKSMQQRPVPPVPRKPRLPPEGLLCSFPHRNCTQERLEGYDYCIRHILEDKTAPFKQCNFISNKTGKRCSNAAPKTDRKDGYCHEHASRAMAIRQRAHRKRRPKESAETLLNSMEHYVTGPKGNGSTLAAGNNGGIEQARRFRGADSIANRALEYATSSESESEGPLVDQAWRGDCDSDADSIDSDQEDPLKHAGIYTAEEVALIARDKLIRLQSLYIDQFKRLQHLMKEKRRRYLHHVKTERDTYGGIHVGEDDTQQRDKYQRLLATMRYHKRYGKEALVHRQSKERRIMSSEGSNYKPPAYPKCIHQQTSGAPKCGARAIPLSKFCFQHIGHDPHQVLYKSCDFGGVCTRPVAKLASDSVCHMHATPSPPEQRYPRPVEPETEDEEDEDDEMKEVSIDVVGSPGVKFEVPMEVDPEPDQASIAPHQGHTIPRNIMQEDGNPEQPTPDVTKITDIEQKAEPDVLKENNDKKTPDSEVKITKSTSNIDGSEDSHNEKDSSTNLISTGQCSRDGILSKQEKEDCSKSMDDKHVVDSTPS